MKHKYQENGYIKDLEWYSCNFEDLNKDCKDLVNDLINSSNVSHRWSDELKHQYFTKAVFIAFDSGRNRRKTKLQKVIENIKDRIFIFVSRLVVYIP